MRRIAYNWMAAAVALITPLVGGCRADLGECNLDAARSVVYYDSGNPNSSENGMPMYEGQALMFQSCGGTGFCHTANATGAARNGVPIGLDFDVSYACAEGPCDVNDETENVDIERLRGAQRNILRWGRHVAASVEAGWMPPGDVGASIAAGLSGAHNFRRLTTADQDAIVAGSSFFEVGTPLPSVNSSAGQRILNNWIACGTPVVESSNVPTGASPGQSCDTQSNPPNAGTCVRRVAVPLEPPNAEWCDIYEKVIAPSCVTNCHGPGLTSFIEESQLDLSTAAIAYEQLVDREAAGDECAQEGTHIVSGDASQSFLFIKMSDEPGCGDRMPAMLPAISADVLAPIREWVNNGAQAQDCTGATE